MKPDLIISIKKILCRFLGHKKGETWWFQGDNSVCKRCLTTYKSGDTYYSLRTFRDAASVCGVREQIYRQGDPSKKYAKNHPIPLKKQVSLLNRLSKDWVIQDDEDIY